MNSVNDTIQDQVIHHSAVNLMKIEASQRNKVFKMMKALEKDLMAELMDLDPTAPKNTAIKMKRLKALIKQTKETIASHIEGLNSTLEKDLYDLAETEAAFLEGSINAALGAQVATVAISASRLKALAGKTLVEGRFPKEWWDKQSKSVQDKFEQQMRLGMNRGESIGELSKRVRDKVMPVSRRNADAIVRTSHMAVVQEARRESYKQVTDIIKGYKYVATLDTRTTPYCRAADGAVLNKDYSVASGPSFVKPPPNHWNCRSTLSPITKSWRELESLYKGTKTMDKLDPIPTATRAAMDGKVPVMYNYTDWLKSRSKDIQNEILGPTRAELFREGKITDMGQLLDQSGSPLTIQDLKARMASGTLLEPITGKVYVNSLSKKGKELAASIKEKEELLAQYQDMDTTNTFYEYSTAPESIFKTVDAPKVNQPEIYEPEFVEIEGMRTSSGVIMFDENTEKVWIFEPKNHYGGYKHSYPKGGVEEGWTLQETALQEAWEETGLQAELLDHFADVEKSTSLTRYYVARSIKGNPTKFGGETHSVKLVPRSELKKYLNMKVDKDIADDFEILFDQAKNKGKGDAVTGFRKMNAEKQKAAAERVQKKLVREAEKAKKAEEALIKAQQEAAEAAQTKAKYIQAIESGKNPPKDLAQAWEKIATPEDYAQIQKIQEAKQAEYFLKDMDSFNADDLLTTAEKNAYDTMKAQKNLVGDPIGQKVAYESALVQAKEAEKVLLKDVKKLASEALELDDGGALYEVIQNAGSATLKKNDPTAYVAKVKEAIAEHKKAVVAAIKEQQNTAPDLWKAVYTEYGKGFQSLDPQEQLFYFKEVEKKVSANLESYQQMISHPSFPDAMSALLSEGFDSNMPISKWSALVQKKLDDMEAEYLNIWTKMGTKSQEVFLGEWDEDVWDQLPFKEKIAHLEIEKNLEKEAFDELASIKSDSMYPEIQYELESTGKLGDYEEGNVYTQVLMLKDAKKVLMEYNDEYIDLVTSPEGINVAHKLAGTPDLLKLWDNMPIQEKLKTLKEELAKGKKSTKTVPVKKSVLYKDLKHHIDLDVDMTEPIPLGKKTYILDDPEDWKAFKPNMTSNLSEYKKSIIAGKNPTKTQQQAYNLLSPEAQEVIQEEIAAHNALLNGTPVPAPKVKAVAPVSETKPVLQFEDYVKYGEKKGSNDGGFYHSETNPGEKWYFKFGASEDIARNELLAGKLYEKAGVYVPELTLVERKGQIGVASRIVDGVKKDGAALKSGKFTKDIEENFIVDAWLGDWDVVGTGYDNMLVVGDRAVRIDVGGSLRYRAQGSIKTSSQWDNIVKEIEDMRNPTTNAYGAEVFEDVTHEQMIIGARKVLSVSDDDIAQLVRRYGPVSKDLQDDMISTLIARKKDLAKRFPEAIPKKADLKKVPAGFKDGEFVTKQEIKDIEDSRVNGVVLRTDTDQIQDLELLVWEELDVDSSKLTLGHFKVRGDGEKILNKLIDESVTKPVDTETVLNLSDVSNDMYKAMQGISMQSRNAAPMRIDKDIPRAKKAIQTYNQRRKDIEAYIKEGRLPKSALKEYEKAYDHWLPHVKVVSEMDVPKVYKFADDIYEKASLGQRTPNISFELKPLKGKKPKKSTVTWEYHHKKRLEKKIVQDGYVQRTEENLSMDLFSENVPSYYEADYGDFVVRYYDGRKNPFAIQGTVEIRVKGQAVTGVDDLYKAMDRLGLKATRATPEYQEELYLIQLMYGQNNVNKFEVVMEGLEKIKDQNKRLEYLRDRYTTWIGKDVLKSPEYQPYGSKQVYNHGRQFNTRPDLALDPEWADFEKKYGMYHDLNFGQSFRSTYDRLNEILNGGGQMAPTVDKLRRGFEPKGGSPNSDMRTGGAGYFFTRIRNLLKIHSSKKAGTIIWKSKILKRTDAISYPADFFGDVRPQVIAKGKDGHSGRTASVSGFKKYAEEEGNETIFKNSLSVLEGIDSIYVESENYEKVKELFRSVLKSDLFPDGTPIDEIVKLGSR